MKGVINTRFGGFSLSKEGEREYESRSKEPLPWDIAFYHVERTNPILVTMIEENSELFSGSHASLKVVTIPDDVQWHIHDYDGQEHVAENHRTWH